MTDEYQESRPPRKMTVDPADVINTYLGELRQQRDYYKEQWFAEQKANVRLIEQINTERRNFRKQIVEFKTERDRIRVKYTSLKASDERKADEIKELKDDRDKIVNFEKERREQYDEIEMLGTDLAQAQSQRDDYKRAYDMMANERDEVREKLSRNEILVKPDYAEKEIKRLKTERDKARDEVHDIDTKLAALHEENEELKREPHRMRKAFRELTDEIDRFEGINRGIHHTQRDAIEELRKIAKLLELSPDYDLRNGIPTKIEILQKELRGSENWARNLQHDLKMANGRLVDLEVQYNVFRKSNLALKEALHRAGPARVHIEATGNVVVTTNAEHSEKETGTVEECSVCGCRVHIDKKPDWRHMDVNYLCPKCLRESKDTGG